MKRSGIKNPVKLEWILSPGSEAGAKGMNGFAKFQKLQDDALGLPTRPSELLLHDSQYALLVVFRGGFGEESLGFLAEHVFFVITPVNDTPRLRRDSVPE